MKQKAQAREGVPASFTAEYKIPSASGTEELGQDVYKRQPIVRFPLPQLGRHGGQVPLGQAVVHRQEFFPPRAHKIKPVADPGGFLHLPGGRESGRRAFAKIERFMQLPLPAQGVHLSTEAAGKLLAGGKSSFERLIADDSVFF